MIISSHIDYLFAYLSLDKLVMQLSSFYYTKVADVLKHVSLIGMYVWNHRISFRLNQKMRITPKQFKQKHLQETFISEWFWQNNLQGSFISNKTEKNSVVLELIEAVKHDISFILSTLILCMIISAALQSAYWCILVSAIIANGADKVSKLEGLIMENDRICTMAIYNFLNEWFLTELREATMSGTETVISCSY